MISNGCASSSGESQRVDRDILRPGFEEEDFQGISLYDNGELANRSKSGVVCENSSSQQ
jgi:hypothetical protein